MVSCDLQNQGTEGASKARSAEISEKVRCLLYLIDLIFGNLHLVIVIKHSIFCVVYVTILYN